MDSSFSKLEFALENCCDELRPEIGIDSVSFLICSTEFKDRIEQALMSSAWDDTWEDSLTELLTADMVVDSEC
jgi:hypothetical protein